MTAVQRRQLWMCMELLGAAWDAMCFEVDCAYDPFSEEIPEEGAVALETVRNDLWCVWQLNVQITNQTPEMIAVVPFAHTVRDWLRRLDFEMYSLGDVRDIRSAVYLYYVKIKKNLAANQKELAA